MHDMIIIRRINGVRHFPHLKNKEDKEKIYSKFFTILDFVREL